MDNVLDKIKVMYLITELHIGGAQHALVQLLNRIDRSKFDVMVACFYNGDQVSAQKIRALGITVVDVGFRKPWQLCGLWRLARMLRKEKPDVLHTWLYHANVVGRIIGKVLKTPIIITSRRNVDIGGKVRDWIQSLTRDFDEATIAVCESARQAEIERCGANPEKVVTIYNGIDFPLFVGTQNSTQVARKTQQTTDTDAIRLGSVGRLHPQKGYDCLLRAIRIVKNEYPNLQVVVVGDGIEKKYLINLALTLELDNEVEFTGFRNDVPAILTSFDLFALPSVWEGMPNVLLEAMAAGLPVIATNVGGIPEMVVNGVTGILVPPENPERMAEAIIQLIRDPDLRTRMGQAGRVWVRENFSIEETTRKTEVLYNRLVAIRDKSS